MDHRLQWHGQAVRVDRFSSEVLAVVERTSEVDELSEGRTPPNIHVERTWPSVHDGGGRESTLVPVAGRSGFSITGELREEDAVPARHRA